MARPETPYIATGVVVVATAIKRDGNVSTRAFQGLFATVLLVLFAAFTGRTAIAPVVRALGILLFIVALIMAVKAWEGSLSTEKRTATAVNRSRTVFRNF